MGFSELGNMSLAELTGIRTPFGVERELHWKANKSLAAYADEARKLG
jgi:DUF2958 family protein